MKPFKGKAIYNPSGKAGEYSEWAANFYTGCSNDCKYCYCKRGVMSHTWSTVPRLKSCFKNEDHALEVFAKELQQNLAELQQHGLFFSFTTDPMLPETTLLTGSATALCELHNIPVKILTKCTDWVDDFIDACDLTVGGRTLFAFGFTLTGHDELEPNASTNAERIEAMRRLHDGGFRTFASIEPIIDLESSLCMIRETLMFCDLYKVGLMSGRKYDREHLRRFIYDCVMMTDNPIYFKDSFLEQAAIDRRDLPYNCIGRDHDIFNHQKLEI